MIQEERIDIQNSVATIPEREEQLVNVQQTIVEKQRNLLVVDKRIVSDLSLSEALSYLNKIQDRYNAFKFNLEYIKDVQLDNYGYKIFTLNGEGQFESILYMIWLLERGPNIFVINDLEVSGIDNGEALTRKKHSGAQSITVQFKLTVKAMYADIDSLQSEDNGFVDLKIPQKNNLFLPLITTTVQPNYKGLLNVESATLRAILPGQAIIADRSGKIHMLKINDEVYLGYLTEIDQENNRVEFRLNKGGIMSTIRLKLSFKDLSFNNHGLHGNALFDGRIDHG